ncbi:MAG: hypothetical protein ABIP94_16205 [Planctomycetota bacterium]
MNLQELALPIDTDCAQRGSGEAKLEHCGSHMRWRVRAERIDGEQRLHRRFALPQLQSSVGNQPALISGAP